MAGPIDCRISPTAVNRLATSKSIEWFEHNLICLRAVAAQGRGPPRVSRVRAGGRLHGHEPAAPHRRLSQLLRGAGRRRPRHSEPIRRFYEEYLAVSDLPAEFYLETVKLVFQDYALPLRRVALARPHGRSAQRSAAPRLSRSKANATTSARRARRWRHKTCARSCAPTCARTAVQAGVGHYGVFSGRRWQQHIYPMLRDVIHVSAVSAGGNCSSTRRPPSRARRIERQRCTVHAGHRLDDRQA